MKKLILILILLWLAGFLGGCATINAPTPTEPNTSTSMHCTDGFCHGKVNGKPTTLHCNAGFCF